MFNRYKKLTNTFCETSYLAQNPDVYIAVNSKQIRSGLEHYLRFGQRENRPTQCNCTTLDGNELFRFGELYHDFKIFGYKNHILPGIYQLNQKSKEPIINAYIQYAIAKSKTKVQDEISFAELFAADCYYAMVACHFGATKSIGIDNNSSGYSTNVTQIANALGIKNFEFVMCDINDVEEINKFDIVANVGGIYHVSNPRNVIEKSYNMAKRFLIIQSAVSMANDDENYYESPAPGWTWGCRFNRYSFDKLIKSLRYDIVDWHFNELEGNDRPEDRGSVYYLVRK